jgi:hypothetical protein
MFRREILRSRFKAGVFFWASASALLASVQGAAAQMADVDDSLRATPPAVVPVERLSRPLYEPAKIELGPFLLAPSLTETATGDDNIFANDRHKAGDVIFSTQEDATLESQWPQDSAAIRLDHVYQEYAGHHDENADTYGAQSEFHFAPLESASLALIAGFQQQPQERNSAQADRLAQRRPIYNTTLVAGRYSQDWNRWHNDLTVGATQTAYIAHADAQRSSIQVRYRDRLSFALTGDTWSFVQVGYSTQDWLIKPDERNLNTQTAMAGFTVEIADIVDADVGAGVLRQEYIFPGFKDLVTPTFSTHLTWNILPMTTLLLSGERTVTGLETFCDGNNIVSNPACAALSGGTLANLRNQLGALEVTGAEIGLQHEFWHNLLGEIRFRFERDKFDPVHLVDNNYSVDVSSRFLVNRNMELNLTYMLNIRTANQGLLLYNSGPYQANMISLALKASL